MKWLKRALLGIGSLVVLFGLTFVISYVLVGRDMDAQSKVAAEAYVKAVGEKWSMKLIEESSDEVLLKILAKNRPMSEKLVKVLSEKLGAFSKIKESKGEAKVYLDLAKLKVNSTAFYKVSATFEKGDAEVSVSLRKVDGIWKLEGFNVNSPRLMGL